MIKEKYIYSMLTALFAIGMIVAAVEFAPSVSLLLAEGLLGIGFVHSFAQATSSKRNQL